MKIAISVPDPVFEAAEKLARTQKKSRSQLYADAVVEYIGAHSANAVREQLNAVYATQSSRLDEVLQKIQLASLKDEAW
jgi:metal-responsive CopG/Arc/MetJ family transcriptional regulator